MRSRVSMTISIGPIRFLRSASRNSATVFASKPARLAPRDAVLAVVFAALRACCWRPRALPPFLAAAVRLAEVERAVVFALPRFAELDCARLVLRASPSLRRAWPSSTSASSTLLERFAPPDRPPPIASRLPNSRCFAAPPSRYPS